MINTNKAFRLLGFMYAGTMLIIATLLLLSSCTSTEGEQVPPERRHALLWYESRKVRCLERARDDQEYLRCVGPRPEAKR